jgi:pilus assembly protein Flp/PilA
MLNNLITRAYLFTRREEGQAMAEYGLILALVAVACIGAFLALQGGLVDKIGDVVTGLGG